MSPDRRREMMAKLARDDARFLRSGPPELFADRHELLRMRKQAAQAISEKNRSMIRLEQFVGTCTPQDEPILRCFEQDLELAKAKMSEIREELQKLTTA
jgi:hypothetical protein